MRDGQGMTLTPSISTSASTLRRLRGRERICGQRFAQACSSWRMGSAMNQMISTMNKNIPTILMKK